MCCRDESRGPASALTVRRADLFRATLADDCGNLGYLGIAPDGSGYHVVVPVDLKLARGVKALNAPDDGTPFGGYRGWHYYECRPYPGKSGAAGRRRQVAVNADLLRAWGRQYGIEITIVD